MSRRINVLSSLLVCGLLGMSCAPRNDQDIRVVLRYDDFSNTSPLALEKELISLFRKHRIPCTFGVIPFVAGREVAPAEYFTGQPLSAEKLAVLNDATREGLVEIALHGFNHRSIRPGPYKTEFSTLAADTQYQKIIKGKEFLEQHLSLQIETFIPPHNRYDVNTLDMLARAGVKNISADTGGVEVWSSPLNFLPATCQVSELKAAISAARKSYEREPVIVALFHGYDFVEANREKGGMSLRDLDQLLGWLADQKDIRAGTVHSLVSEGRDFSVGRYIDNYTELEPLRRILPSAIFNMMRPKGVYLTTAAAKRAKGMIQTVSLMIYLLLGGSFFIIAYRLSPFRVTRKEGPKDMIRVAMVMAWCVVLIVLFTAGSLGVREAMSATILAGGLAGLSWPPGKRETHDRCKRHNFALSRAGVVIK